jgi:hypothetical protein
MIQNRADLKNYCLRELGWPLIEIDITDEAADDRIDEAIAFMREYYYDGSDRMFYRHEVTADDIANKYITVPSYIWGVNAIFPIGTSSANIFSYEYQFRSSDMMRNLSSSNLVYYTQVMEYFSMVETILNVKTQFRYNRNTDKIYLDTNWDQRIQVGTWLMFDCYAAIDPEVNTKFWNNRAFKEYVTILFKMQWSRAYSKYDNIQLPGGVTISGQKLYTEAKEERKAFEEDIINNQSPLSFFTA